jgi:biopolymer transport protein ExbD
MRIHRSRAALQPGIPTATMADIAFLLIIFFMVTTAFTIDRTAMELPQTREQQQVPKGSAIIAITREGALRFSAGEEDTKPVAGMAELSAAVRRVTAANSLHAFVIKADRQVPYRVIDEVLERLRLAGAENVSLLSQAEPQK